MGGEGGGGGGGGYDTLSNLSSTTFQLFGPPFTVTELMVFVKSRKSCSPKHPSPRLLKQSKTNCIISTRVNIQKVAVHIHSA